MEIIINKNMTEENQNKDKIIRNWQFVAMGLVIVFTFFISIDRGVFGSFLEALEEEVVSIQTQEDLEIKVTEGERVEETINGEVSEIIPIGIPPVYGEDLDISYDDVSPNAPREADSTIEVMAEIDRNTELQGADLERYIDILHNMHGGISCEFCCGADSIIFENGESACGCAHSFAMRGITKYLILNSDMTGEEILSEVGKWKVLFFPGSHEQKASVMKEQDIEVNYVSLTTNENRGIEAGAEPSGMVGGC